VLLASAVSLVGACSLHSLDYLGADRDGFGVGGSSNGAGAGAGGGGSAAGGMTSGPGGRGGTSGSTSEPGGSGHNVGAAGESGAAGAQPEAPDCSDGLATVDETDEDCGGRTCEPCVAGSRCVTGTDCQSGICTNQVCQAPNCNDLALNGDETDLNCGGSCPRCAQGRHCSTDADCETSTCVSGICESATCTDGVLKPSCPLLVDNTAYTLSPGHALTRCIDDYQRSVADGNAMVTYSCNSAVNQVFWAIESAGGYFALRSALSAKCLQPRGGSLDAGTVIEQATCDASDRQLWKPSIVDASLMQLTSKLSGLALDVAGTNVGTDAQNIVQSAADGSPDTHWRAVRATSGAYIALSPNGSSDLRLRHDGALTTLTNDDQPSAHWKVVPGLDDAALISFQSRNDPGRYLRHALYRLWTDTDDGTEQFKQDATFRYTNPLAGTASLSKSFEAINYSGCYWQRDGDAVVIRPFQDNSDYKFSTTWWISTR
jgi:hypothetical protein